MASINSLPLEILNLILKSLPMEERARFGVVNQWSAKTASAILEHTQTLDLCTEISRELSPDHARILFSQCAKVLQSIKVPTLELLQLLAEERPGSGPYCPQLTEIDASGCDYAIDVCNGLIRNHPKLKRLIYPGRQHVQIGAEQFRFPNIVTPTLETLVTADCDAASLESLTGRVPNLERFYGHLHNMASGSLDAFLASTAGLRRLNIEYEPIFDVKLTGAGALTDFWHLSALRSLTFQTTSRRRNMPPIEITDTELGKIAISFPLLEKLSLSCSSISGAGIGSLGSLGLLKKLELFCVHRVTIVDSGHVSFLGSSCRNLRVLTIHNLTMSPNSFFLLMNSCQGLACLNIDSIADNQTGLADGFNALVGTGARELSVWFRCKMHTKIWKCDMMKGILLTVAQNIGLYISVYQTL